MDLSFLDQLDQPAERPIHPAALGSEALMAQCTMTRGRSSGPGGQHRNKVQTHVTLTHQPTGISAQAGERRQAGENQSVALRRLRLQLAIDVRVGVPSGEIRSELWRSRCRNRKIVCATKHADFPALLAEALDVIEACALDMPKASARLVCSPTQLLRLIAAHPPALVDLNRKRQDRSMRPLRA